MINKNNYNVNVVQTKSSRINNDNIKSQLFKKLQKYENVFLKKKVE